MGVVLLEERAEYDAAVRGAEVSVISFLAGWSKPCKTLRQALQAASEEEQHEAEDVGAPALAARRVDLAGLLVAAAAVVAAAQAHLGRRMCVPTTAWRRAGSQ